MSKISKEDILKIAEQENIGYVKLQFTDILGALKKRGNSS
jgi:Glutamine synthetase